MTRQKKELMEQIRQIEMEIAADEELGCGFAPPDAYREMEKEIWKLREEPARLSHYGSAEEMMYDTRGVVLPFN